MCKNRKKTEIGNCRQFLKLKIQIKKCQVFWRPCFLIKFKCFLLKLRLLKNISPSYFLLIWFHKLWRIAQVRGMPIYGMVLHHAYLQVLFQWEHHLTSHLHRWYRWKAGFIDIYWNKKTKNQRTKWTCYLRTSTFQGKLKKLNQLYMNPLKVKTSSTRLKRHCISMT